MEVLLVLVILVILGSFSVGIFTNVRRKANIDTARTQIGLTSSQIDLYQVNMNSYPPTLDALLVPPVDVPNVSEWAGPYTKNKLNLDPWGNPYQYVSPGQFNVDSYDLWSLGPDGQSGTEDDIGNFN